MSFSNDEASARCITTLSYEYIHGALLTAGLYETGKGGIWLGAPYAQAPAGTPAEIIQRLSAEIQKAVKSPEVSKQLVDMALVPVGSTPAEATKFLSGEVANRWCCFDTTD